MIYIAQILFLFGLFACSGNNATEKDNLNGTSKKEQNYSEYDTATFAGGCFWCIEASFDQIKGVKEAVSGYAGGNTQDPDYKEVSSGNTGHAETVQIYYDPDKIDYKTLLDIFFTAHDPTQLNRQGPDVGSQYRSAVFYHNKNQQIQVQNKIRALENSEKYKKNIVTKINPYKHFYKAEKYHQNYEEKNPDNRYIQNVSKPKIEKVREKFPHLIKEE